MTKSLAFVLFGASWVGRLHAQLDLLTLREAESIMERIPAVAEAKLGGDCPQLSASYWSADQFWFQVRDGCGPKGGMLVGNYLLNRRTGTATTTGDLPVAVGSTASKAFAQQLVHQAQSRILSIEESRCLAAEAARALPGWSGTDGSVSVDVLDRPSGDKVRFTARWRSSIRPAESWRVLTVDTTTGLARDDETGLGLMSGGLGALTSKMLALRESPWLSDQDALLIAFQIPSVVAGIRNGCRLSAVGAFWSDETQVALACGGRQAAGGVAATINLRTGQAGDAATGKPLDESPDAARLASQLLEGIRKRKSELQRAVDAVCHAGEGDVR